MGDPTTLILVRHGETEHTKDRRFSGTGGTDPGLHRDGEDQVRTTGAWLAPLADDIHAIVTSPLRRTRESAAILSDLLGKEVEVEDGLAEAAFGTWDGLTFDEVRAAHPDDLEAWLGGASTSRPPVAASRSAPSTPGWRQHATGCSRPTRARRWSWSAT